VRAKRIQFGPGDTIGGTAPLIMMRDIDGYQPRRRRHRRGRGFAWAVLAVSVLLTAWVIVDGIQRGVLFTILG